MIKLLAKLRKNNDGATVIEYGLAVAVISLAAVVALEAVGQSVFAFYETIDKHVENAGPINP